MDVAQINEIAATSWTYGQWLPVAAGCAAGIAAFALFAGFSKLHRKTWPARFPADPDAGQPKYALAFRQLTESADVVPDGSTKITADPGRPAVMLCVASFTLFTNTPEAQPVIKQKTKKTQ